MVKQVISYRCGDKRKNNPQVGMVDTVSDGVEGQTPWTYDPHIDPTLNFDTARVRIENPKGIKTKLNEPLSVQFRGTKSLLFTEEIVANRSIESLNVMGITA